MTGRAAVTAVLWDADDLLMPQMVEATRGTMAMTEHDGEVS